MGFTFKKFLTLIILPPGSFLLLIALGLILVRSRPRSRRGLTLAWLGVLGLLLLSAPITATFLTRLVSDATLLHPAELQAAQAIVILGGGLRRNAIEYGTDVPSGLTMDRLRYGANLARRSNLPVLVTGGRVHGIGRAEADVMREVLERDFQVRVRWIEDASRNTHENAVFTARVLKAASVSRIILVTHAVDARRARREFQAAGLVVKVAPTLIPTITGPDSWVQYMPNANALQGSALAVYELIANLAMTLGLSKP